MTTIEDIINLINNCGIKLFHSPLPDSVRGTYYSDTQVTMIVMNESLSEYGATYKTILAEELGHYFTSVGDNTPKKHMSYGDKLRIDKSEELALRWASNYLMPNNHLIESLKQNRIETIQDIACIYNVTEEFTALKLEFMSREQRYWNLDETRTLVLSSLPSVFVYNRMEEL